MTVTRRFFFSLLGIAPLAVPAAVRAAAEPVAADAGLQTGQVVTTAFRGWQEVVAQIRAEEVAVAAMQLKLSTRVALSAVTGSLDHTFEQIRTAKKILVDLGAPP